MDFLGIPIAIGRRPNIVVMVVMITGTLLISSGAFAQDEERKAPDVPEGKSTENGKSKRDSKSQTDSK